MTSRPRAYLLLTAAVICVSLSEPLAASATTGTQTEFRVKITISAKGTSWSPPLGHHHATTGTTLRVQVVNEGPGRHWFRLGTRKTKLLAKGASATFFYNFIKPGKVAWQTGPGKGLGAGQVPVVFPPSFH
jgi:hypothetical protein